MSDAKFKAAEELIKEGHYSVARELLRTIAGHPDAQAWIEKLDAMAPQGRPFPQVQPEPAEYEYQSIRVQPPIWKSLDAATDEKIAYMRDAGWDYVTQHDDATGIISYARIRVVQFRRIKKKRLDLGKL